MRKPHPEAVRAAADRAERSADGKADGRKGRGQLSSLDLLPEEAGEDVAWAVAELNKRAKTQADILFEFNDRLAAKGIDPISRSAFNRASMRLAAMSARLTEARKIFEGIAPQLTPERIDDTNVALAEFLKLLVFELVQNPADAYAPKDAMELARAHLAVIQGQKISADRRQKVEAEAKARLMKAAEAAVDQAAEGGKIADPQAVLRRIREDVYGIHET